MMVYKPQEVGWGKKSPVSPGLLWSQSGKKVPGQGLGIAFPQRRLLWVKEELGWAFRTWWSREVSS